MRQKIQITSPDFDKVKYCPVCKEETLKDYVTGIYGDSRKSTHYCETCANYLIIEVIDEE